MADDTTTVDDETEDDDTSTDAAAETTETAPEDWKAHARKHEREAKRLRKELEQREAKLREREEAEQSETEKAIAKAREEARNEALTEAQQERRNDRLEVAVTRLSAKKFADTEDALLHVQRAINSGDIDPDDIFTTEGKVQTDALTTALDELLERKPHLKAAPGQPAGDADGGKGTGPKDPESLGVEDHLKHIQRR